MRTNMESILIIEYLFKTVLTSRGFVHPPFVKGFAISKNRRYTVDVHLCFINYPAYIIASLPSSCSLNQKMIGSVLSSAGQ